MLRTLLFRNQKSAKAASVISASAAQPISLIVFGAVKNCSTRSLPPAAFHRSVTAIVLNV